MLISQTKEKLLRCYAKKTALGRWYAVCVDLNLDAEAESFPAVKQSLDEAIVGYFHTVLDTQDKESLLHLLSRPAPLGDRLTYYVIKHLPKLRSKRHGGDWPYVAFKVPLSHISRLF